MKNHKFSTLTFGVLLALGCFEGGVCPVHAGDSKGNSDGYYRPYGSNPPYDSMPEVNPRGKADNQWLSRLFKCQPEAEQRGWVRVGSPQVYSRQLVFRDRAEEIQFLSDRLKATKEFHLKYQGVVDARYYAALATQLAVSFDPATGKLLDQQQRNVLLNSQQQSQLIAVQNEVALLNLKQQLAIANNTLEKIQNDKTTTTVPAASDPKTQQDIEAMKKQIEELKTKIASLNVPVVGDQQNTMQPEVDGTKKPLSPVLATGGAGASTADKAGLTQIEEEKSILEVRRFLQNERRRLTFDDMHDASGSIVLELGMLVTLMPPANKDDFAVVELTVEKPDRRDDQDYNYTLLLQRWADYLAPAVQTERDFASVRYGSLDIMPPTEKLMQIARSQLLEESNPTQPDDAGVKAIENRGMAKEKLAAVLDNHKPSLVELRSALRASAPAGSPAEKMVRSFTQNLLTKSASTVASATSATPVQGGETGTAQENFKIMNRYLELYYGDEFMKAFNEHQTGNGSISEEIKQKCFRFLNWTDKGVKVLSVDPAEQAQNISMVGAVQTIRDNVLSLNAALGGGVAGSARSDYYRDSQMYLQSANRKPLAVGFVNGSLPEPSFGWILGPRFEVEMKRRWYQLGFLGEKRPTPVFMHEPTAHQVQVVVSLPTWVPTIMLKVKAHWINRRTGLPSTRIQTPLVYGDDWNFQDPSQRKISECAARIPVHLEPDYAALTEGLLDYIHGKRRPPRIFMQDPLDKFPLSSDGNKHYLVLLGKDLWRTPAVYLDSMPADSVEVMPGLAGVVATFEGSLPPSEDEFYSVTVSTTGGYDTIRNVVVAPSKPKTTTSGPATPLLSVETPHLDYNFAAAGPLGIWLKVDSNPYPIALEKYLKSSIRIPGSNASTDCTLTTIAGGRVQISLADVTKSLKDQLAGLVPPAPASEPSAVKIACNVGMPLVDEATNDIHQKNVIQGSHEVILFKPGSKVFKVTEASNTTDPLARPLGPNTPELNLSFPANLDTSYFISAHPSYKTALEEGNLKLLVMNGHNKLSLPQTSANTLTFRMPSSTNASEVAALGLKKESPSATFTPTLVVTKKDGTMESFPIKPNLTLSIPTQ